MAEFQHHPVVSLVTVCSQYRLVPELAYCLGKAPPVPPISVGTVAGIAIFAAALGLVCAGVAYSVIRKKPAS